MSSILLIVKSLLGVMYPLLNANAVIIPSPSGAQAIWKQYSPYDEAEAFSLTLEKLNKSDRRSIPFLSGRNPSGVMGGDGITIGWTGEHHLTVGWPKGAKAIGGPDRVGDVDVDYHSYVSDITSQQQTTGRVLPLRNVSVEFNELDGQYGTGRYKATGKRVPLIQCILAISGADGQLFDQVTVELMGKGIGLASKTPHSYGGIGIKVSVKPLPGGGSPALTLTQAEVAGVFPRNDVDTAPSQGADSISYRLLNTTEARRVFSSIKGGSLDVKLALTLGQQVLAYHLDLPEVGSAFTDFNACSAKTNIYGKPFSIPQLQHAG